MSHLLAILQLNRPHQGKKALEKTNKQQQQKNKIKEGYNPGGIFINSVDGVQGSRWDLTHNGQLRSCDLQLLDCNQNLCRCPPNPLLGPEQI